MYCSRCGRTLDDGVRYCGACGTAVGGASPPQSAEHEGRAMLAGAPATTYSPLRTLGRAAVIGLAVVILVDLVAVVSDFIEIRLITRLINGEDVSFADLDSSDDRQAVIGVFQVIVVIGTAIAYLMWMYRARKNLEALNVTGLKYSAGWSIGAWFVPILNLFRPYQITAEIARASKPLHPADGATAWHLSRVPSVLGFWWAAWIVNEWLGRLLLRSAFSPPDTLEGIRTESYLILVSDGFDVVAAGLAIAVVMAITSAQSEKHRLLSATPPEAT